MSVAIMGAGLSGLCCALTLERRGHKPVIYESKGKVGDGIPRAEIMLPTFCRPIKDETRYLSENFGIFLNPTSSLKHATFYSENSSADLFGNLGTSNIRGDHPDSYENQLLKQVQSRIIYNSTKTYDALKAAYTHVVIATGDPRYVTNIQSIRSDIYLNVRGATVIGKFDTHHMFSWLDNTLAPKGFALLTPINKQKATIVIALPQYLTNGQINLEELWVKFLERIYKDTGIEIQISDEFQMKEMILSRSQTPKVGNTYFTGNCLCAMGPAFGIGQFNSMLSGIYAALDICKAGDYRTLTQNLFTSYEHSLAIRRGLEKLDNHKLDTLVRAVDKPIVNRLVTSKINFAKYLSVLLKLLNHSI